MSAYTVLSSAEWPSLSLPHEHYDHLDLSCLTNAGGVIQTHQTAMNSSPTSHWRFDHDNVLDFGATQIDRANSELTNGEDTVPSKPFARKHFHNARERDRRKKLNGLYSELRSLLPRTNSKRKLSIPNTVLRVLKYIPELRNEIEELGKQRDQMLSITKPSYETSKSANSGEAESVEPQPALGSSDYLDVKVNAPLGSSDLIITICTCNDGFQLSPLLRVLERQGLDLVNASTFFSGNKVYSHLQVQMISPKSELDTNLLQNKLLLLCEKNLQAVRPA